MPYISQIVPNTLRSNDVSSTPLLKHSVDKLIKDIQKIYSEEEREGVCNYVISRVVAGVMKPQDGWRYKWLNRAHGTFLSAAAEFYRRLVIPYEDKCILKNGDIPEYQDN